MPAILGANSVSGYDVSNSLRFNAGDSPYLGRTPGSAGTSVQTWTFSCWAKRSTLSGSQVIFGASNGDASQFVDITINGNNVFELDILDSNSTRTIRTSTAIFRDPTAWYHFVIVVDTTQSTDTNRLKLYVNGDEIATSAGTGTYPAQNANTQVNATTGVHAIGRRQGSTDRYYGGYLTEINHVDGQALTPASFGEEDDNGVWIPKRYTGTYGTNGFFLQFKQTGTSQNASGMGADTSGNTHHWTVNNLTAIDVTTDTCTNNFATINSLLTNDGSTHSEGNTKLVTPDGPGISGPTIAMTAGKWYAEFTCTAKSTVNMNVGIVRADSFDGNNQMDEGNNVGYMYQNNGNIFHGGANESYGASWAVDDIIGIAFNADNLNVEFFKNGAGQGNYTRITSENSGGDWYMCVGEGQASTTATFVCNFGNPAYTNSSSVTDGKYGDFEYAPPSGYYALCTKRLAEFG